MAGRHRKPQTSHPIRMRLGVATAVVALGVTGGAFVSPAADASTPIVQLASVTALPVASPMDNRGGDDHNRGGDDRNRGDRDNHFRGGRDNHFRGDRDNHFFRGQFCPRWEHWSPWLHRCVR